MKKRNSDNLRIKRQYLVWRKDAKGQSDATIDKVAASINRYERYQKGGDFRAFHAEKARGFKRYLAAERNEATGNPLSAGTIDAMLRDLNGFFLWLADQSGYRSKLRHSDSDYFTSDRRDFRASRGGCWKPHPSPEQVRHALSQMPEATVFERRDRALVAFLFLTGSRVSAAITIRLNHVDLAARCVHFDGRSVNTKFGKSFTTTYFPVGTQIEKILSDWIAELRRDHLWSPTDPLFPKTRVERGPDGHFGPVCLNRRPWPSPTKLAQVFNGAFVAAGLPPFPPHRIRDTLAEMAREFCRSPEDYKAWSQNLGHEDVLTTFTSYGSVAAGRQSDIIKALGRRGPVCREVELDLFER